MITTVPALVTHSSHYMLFLLSFSKYQHCCRCGFGCPCCGALGFGHGFCVDLTVVVGVKVGHIRGASCCSYASGARYNHCLGLVSVPGGAMVTVVVLIVFTRGLVLLLLVTQRWLWLYW